MNLPDEKLLQSILFGGSLADKLLNPGAVLSTSFARPEFRRDALDADSILALTGLTTPGRLGKLAPGAAGKFPGSFPKNRELKNTSDRGRLLHYFANHELLAIETMAFVLLRFPEADPAFRAGVLRTLQDEQRHLRQYLKRMHDFGVELGDFSLNLYFWNTLRQMKSPLDFVTQMSLTFEQANLDFACFYAKLFQTEINDAETGRLLQEVHDDEIKHVAHGMKWFDEWRDRDESEFDSYRKLLPYPMTPRRARGNFLFAAESRSQAGMSADFVEAVRIAGGSRGKVPSYFYFNPQGELESTMPELSRALQLKVDELAPILLWLAQEEDVVELPIMPELQYLTQVFNFKGALPEILTEMPGPGRYAAFESFRPWGWSRGAWKKFAKLSSPVRLPPSFSPDLHAEDLFSKLYWKKTLANSDSENLLCDEDHPDLLIKLARSTSGRGHLKIARSQLQSLEIQAKLAKIRARGDEVVIEPYYDKVCDFSTQYELTQDQKLIEFEPRFFKVDHLFQYQGSVVGKAHHHAYFSESAKCIEQKISEIKSAHSQVVEVLKSRNYVGPFGIDSLTYRAKDGQINIAPVIEVNARYTMGRVAHEIEIIAQGKKQKQGIYRILNARDLADFGVFSFSQLEEKLKTEYGESFVAVTPSSAKETWVFAVFHRNAIDRFLLN